MGEADVLVELGAREGGGTKKAAVKLHSLGGSSTEAAYEQREKGCGEVAGESNFVDKVFVGVSCPARFRVLQLGVGKVATVNTDIDSSTLLPEKHGRVQRIFADAS